MQGPDKGVQGHGVESEETSEVSAVVFSAVFQYLHFNANALFRLIFYEPVGKGGGIAAKSFDQISRFVGAAYDKITTCGCENGCETCTILMWTHVSLPSDLEVPCS